MGDNNADAGGGLMGTAWSLGTSMWNYAAAAVNRWAR